MNIRWIQKQSGHVEAFDLKKLERSIASAMRHAKIADGKRAHVIAHEAQEHLEDAGRETTDADAVRQAVLHVLKRHHEERAAESYELTSLHMRDLTIHGVMKRNGRVEPFHPLKLFKAIKKSFRDAGLHGGSIAEALTRTLIEDLSQEYRGISVPSAEIRRRTALLLKKRGFGAAEKMYVLHKYS